MLFKIKKHSWINKYIILLDVYIKKLLKYNKEDIP